MNEYGKNLLILIKCEYVNHHDWMSFLSWYSIRTNLPDAKMCVLCKRGMYTTKSLFSWVYKCKIPFIQYKDKYSTENICKNTKILEITPEIACIDVLKETLDIYPTNSDEDCSFVNYYNKCGNFIGPEWILKNKNIFENINECYSDNMTLNEHKVLSLAKSASILFKMIRGM
jgi:hypothetical protein